MILVFNWLKKPEEDIIFNMWLQVACISSNMDEVIQSNALQHTAIILDKYTWNKKFLFLIAVGNP